MGEYGDATPAGHGFIDVGPVLRALAEVFDGRDETPQTSAPSSTPTARS